MSKSKKLTKKQLAVMDDLFKGEQGEQKVLDEHHVARTLFEKWFKEERFTREFERRIERAYRQSRTVLAASTRNAAERLVSLTTGVGETARKACLDIINRPQTASRKTPADTSPVPQPAAPAPDLSPETASRLLAALAKPA